MVVMYYFLYEERRNFVPENSDSFTARETVRQMGHIRGRLRDALEDAAELECNADCRRRSLRKQELQNPPWPHVLKNRSG